MGLPIFVIVHVTNSRTYGHMWATWQRRIQVENGLPWEPGVLLQRTYHVGGNKNLMSLPSYVGGTRFAFSGSFSTPCRDCQFAWVHISTAQQKTFSSSSGLVKWTACEHVFLKMSNGKDAYQRIHHLIIPFDSVSQRWFNARATSRLSCTSAVSLSTIRRSSQVLFLSNWALGTVLKQQQQRAHPRTTRFY